jgi:Mu-like prophage protein Com.
VKATDFERDRCKVGKRHVAYAALTRAWRCNECGGRLVEKWTEELDWHVRCGRCGATDFIHEAQYARERREAEEVLEGLPPEFVAALEQ